MKKILCVLLSLILLVTAAAPVFAAEEQTSKNYPTIIVAGYSSTNLYLRNDDGTEEHVWGVEADDILSLVLHRFAQVGISLGAFAFGNYQMIADVVGQGMTDLYGVLACADDGSSLYDLKPKSQEAQYTSFSYLYANGLDIMAHEPEIMADVAKCYGEYGYDNIFSFQTDFRMSITSCAADLDRYIENVLEYTNAEKVNLYAVSHGGEVCAVYFSLFGDKQQVNNAVLTVPAIGGAALAYDVMSENVKLDEEVLLRFIENGMMWEEDYEWLVKAQQLGILDPLCNTMIRKYIKPNLLGNWGSIWDFIPCEYYDELKAAYLDEEKNAQLISNSDYYHYEIMPAMSRKLSECIENGTNIYIVAGTDNKSVTGLEVQSDAIITVNASTGSLCAPFGTRFADGYTGIGSVCTDKTHNHVSPAMNIDASAAYIPEYTWFVSGLFHGMTWKDPYCIDLCLTLLFSDERLDVHSSAKYPQFHYSNNTCYTVTGQFDASGAGFFSSEDGSFLVTNLSKKHVLELRSINCYGADLTFEVKPFTFIRPGETVSVSVSGKVPETSFTTADVTVNYKLHGSITPIGSRTLTFTVLNGDITEAGTGFVSGSHETPFDKAHGEFFKSILQKLGLLEFFRMVYNFIVGLFR